MAHLTERPRRSTFPVNLIAGGRPALVVGGGQVGRRKTKLLLEAGAEVELVCPDAVAELEDLAAAGDVRWTRRRFEPGDAKGKWLAFACTDDKHVNRAVLDAARAEGVPCCCADGNWAEGDFTTPASCRDGDVTVSVSTSGQNCREARDLRDDIASMLGGLRNPGELVAIGTSDALLSSRKRAPFHLPSEERAVLGPMLERIKGVREFFILNTCNRVEVVAVADPSPETEAVLMRLAGFDRLADNERFVHRGYGAFRHLALVASGLESSLLGEYHVVSQLKGALEEAERNGWTGPELRRTGDEVLRVSKTVRHATEGLLRVAEIDQLAVRYLGVHGGLDAKTRVAVVGTGMVGTGVVEALKGTGAQVTWVYHVHRPDFPSSVPLAELPQVLEKADIVLCAVDSSRPVVTPEMRGAVADRNVLFVDLGVPRNVDPFYDDWGRGVTVADLDDLKLWHRVKTGTLNEVLSRADETIRREYREI